MMPTFCQTKKLSLSSKTNFPFDLWIMLKLAKSNPDTMLLITTFLAVLIDRCNAKKARQCYTIKLWYM